MSTELPVALDIERIRGDTKPFRFTIKDEDGADQNVSGFTFRLTVTAEKDPPDADEQLFQVVGTSASAGNFQFVPTTDNVDLIGTYYYDVQMVDGSGHIYTVYKGKMKFKQDVTKETN